MTGYIGAKTRAAEYDNYSREQLDDLLLPVQELGFSQIEIELGGEFIAGSKIVLTKIANLVMLTALPDPANAGLRTSSAVISAESDSNIIPIEYQPTETGNFRTVDSVYSRFGGTMKAMRVSGGDITLYSFDETLTDQATEFFGRPFASWVTD